MDAVLDMVFEKQDTENRLSNLQMLYLFKSFSTYPFFLVEKFLEFKMFLVFQFFDLLENYLLFLFLQRLYHLLSRYKKFVMFLFLPLVLYFHLLLLL